MSAKKWRNVRVMISSTFRDMHAERDLLVRTVFPALRQRLEPHRINLIDIDLRWGVTREQAENDQVIDLCLTQIDECRPFFIGLLGERYGWTPMDLPRGLTARHSWIEGHRQASVTELEFLYGATRTESFPSTRQLFFIRDPAALADIPNDLRMAVYEETDPDRKQALAALKTWVRQSGCPVVDGYSARWDGDAIHRLSRSNGKLSGLDELAEQAIELLWEVLRAELKLPERAPDAAGDLSLEDEIDAHERFIESRLSIYVGRQGIQESLFTYADSSDRCACLLTGPSGIGKSAALAKFVSGVRQKLPSSLVIAHFVGAGRQSADVRALLRRCCFQLNEGFAVPAQVPSELPDLILAFRDALIRASNNGSAASNLKCNTHQSKVCT